VDGILEDLGFDLAHGLSDQCVGSEGWRQSPAMEGIRHLLRPELRGILEAGFCQGLGVGCRGICLWLCFIVA